MSNDFEIVRDHDEADIDCIDPEEPASWIPDASPVSGEVDDADWAEQQVPIDDSPFDVDSTA